MADIATNTLQIGGNNLILQDAAVRSSLANAYSASSTYAVGDMVLKDGQLYECNTAISTAEAWTAAHWTAVTVGGEIATVKDGLQTVQTEVAATLITDTASGAIASFPDGADGVPVKSLTVDIEPVQDLHGQANPYPAGGGKNLIPLTESAIKSISGETWTGDSVVENGVTFTIQKDNGGNVIGISANGTPSSNVAQLTIARVNITEGSYTFSGITGGGANSFYVRYVVRDSNGQAISIEGSVFVDVYTVETTKTLPSNASYVNAYLGVAVAVSNKVFTPMIRLSSVTDGTFAPYSNICPITGHTSAVVTRTGKNLASFGGQGYWNTSGVFTPDTVTVHSSPVFVKNGQSVSIKSRADTVVSHTIAVFNDKDLTEFLSRTASSTSKELHFTATQDCYIIVQINANFIAITEANYETVAKEQIEYGTTATEYEEPNPTEYTIDLDGTRYGGSLDVGTGVLTVDRVIKTLDGSEDNWVYASGSGGYFYYNPTAALFPNIKTYDSTVISNRLKTVGDGTAFASNTFCIYNASQLNFKCDTSVNTVALFKSWLGNNPLTVVYPLATPTTVQLTAQDDITTVKGQNNIWNDCGDTTVEYRADTALKLDNKIDKPSTAGTSGQVLTSDGEGGQYWNTPSGGGGGSSPDPYTGNPAALGTASPGSSNNYSRGDHVHPMPTAANVGAIASPSSPATGAFLVYNGSAWVAQTLATWQGGSY